MKKILLLLVLAIACTTTFAQVTDISEARIMPDGTTVTVEGIITNGDELGVIRYIQDATGGIGIYSPDFADDLVPGSLVRITGDLGPYNGLAEIVDLTDVEVVDASAGIPTPQSLTASIGFSEAYEGMLVAFAGVNFTSATITENAGTFSASSDNYEISDGTNVYQVRINASTNIANTPIPEDPINLVGIMSQYNPSGEPGMGYQLLPRSLSDVQFLDSQPVFASNLNQSNITNTSFTIDFETLNDGNTLVAYGSTPDLELGELSDDAFTTSHSVDITGLEPGSIYYVQATSTSSAGDSSESAVQVFATESESSGEIKVYFNRFVDTSVSTGVDAISLGYDLADTLVSYIGRATETIDICMYSADLSNGIVDALNAAADSGIQVRIVGDTDLTGFTYTSLPGEDGVDKVRRPTSEGIMHNKFMIIDKNASNPNLPIVWTGSTNYTDDQINVDPNNVIIVQDQSLARGFNLEFEEMFIDGRFGDNKINNTPTEYKIGGIRVESYFSPTDPMNEIIEGAIDACDHDAYFGLLSFTRTDLANRLLNRHYDGVFVAGIIENTENAAVVDILSDLEDQFIIDGGGDIFHHKYLIGDPNMTSSDPFVLTGSHNWSNSAQFRNDENTLIVHDATIANIYYQEFVARYIELGGTALVDSIVFVPNIPKQLNASINVYPNPTAASLNVQYETKDMQEMNIVISNSLGQAVYQNRIQQANLNEQFSLKVSHLPNGVYFLKINDQVRKFTITK